MQLLTTYLVEDGFNAVDSLAAFGKAHHDQVAFDCVEQPEDAIDPALVCGIGFKGKDIFIQLREELFQFHNIFLPDSGLVFGLYPAIVLFHFCGLCRFKFLFSLFVFSFNGPFDHGLALFVHGQIDNSGNIHDKAELPAPQDSCSNHAGYGDEFIERYDYQLLRCKKFGYGKTDFLPLMLHNQYVNSIFVEPSCFIILPVQQDFEIVKRQQVSEVFDHIPFFKGAADFFPGQGYGCHHTGDGKCKDVFACLDNEGVHNVDCRGERDSKCKGGPPACLGL